MKINLEVFFDQIRDLSVLSSEDETRQILNGVFVDIAPAGEVLFVATDGRRLGVINPGLVVSPAPEKRTGFVIPRELIEVIPECGLKAILEYGSETQRIRISVAGGLSFSGRAHEGNYPNWREVLPPPPYVQAGKIVCDYNLLEGFVSACGKSMHGWSGIALYRNVPTQSGEDYRAPIVVATSNPDFFGILMPMKSLDGDGNLPPKIDRPTWLRN